MKKHMIKRDSFVFYRSFYEAIAKCPDKAQLTIFHAIVNYGLDRKVSDFSGTPDQPFIEAIWAGIRPQLDANYKRYLNGCKGSDYGRLGGAPKGNGNNPKITPKQPQDNPKITPNDNVNENANGNANENANKRGSLTLPHQDKEFVDTWNLLISQPQWKQKTVSALQMSLDQLAKYDPRYAVLLMKKAIECEYKRVVFDDTETKYKKWQRTTSRATDSCDITVNELLIMAKRKDYRENQSLIDVSFPDTIEFEIQVLGDLIQNPEMIAEACATIDESMFLDGDTIMAWRIINEMSGQGIIPDFVSVGAKIPHDTMSRIRCVEPSGPMQTERHIQILIDLSVRRRIFNETRMMAFDAANLGSDFSKLISGPERLVAAISENTGYGYTARTLSEVFNDLAADIEKTQAGNTIRVPTGIPNLDKLILSGFDSGNLIILAGRPSIGKSAIMLHMALAAARKGFPVLIESLEMNASEIMDRLTWSTGLVTPEQRRNNTVDFANLEAAFREFQTIPLVINDKPKTLDQLCGDIIMERQRGRCSVVFIDHLGLIKKTDNKQPRYQSLGEMTKRLKDISKECKMPVVVLCQLNRNSESDGRPPKLYDLRDSGEIEEDADIVLMLERETHSRDNPNINMYVRKNRQGPADVCIPLTGSRYMTVFNQRE